MTFSSKFRTRTRSCKIYGKSTMTTGSDSVMNKNPGLNCLKLVGKIHCGINETLLRSFL